MRTLTNTELQRFKSFDAANSQQTQSSPVPADSRTIASFGLIEGEAANYQRALEAVSNHLGETALDCDNEDHQSLLALALDNPNDPQGALDRARRPVRDVEAILDRQQETQARQNVNEGSTANTEGSSTGPRPIQTGPARDNAQSTTDIQEETQASQNVNEGSTANTEGSSTGPRPIQTRPARDNAESTTDRQQQTQARQNVNEGSTANTERSSTGPRPIQTRPARDNAQRSEGSNETHHQAANNAPGSSQLEAINNILEQAYNNNLVILQDKLTRICSQVDSIKTNVSLHATGQNLKKLDLIIEAEEQRKESNPEEYRKNLITVYSDKNKSASGKKIVEAMACITKAYFRIPNKTASALKREIRNSVAYRVNHNPLLRFLLSDQQGLNNLVSNMNASLQNNPGLREVDKQVAYYIQDYLINVYRRQREFAKNTLAKIERTETLLNQLSAPRSVQDSRAEINDAQIHRILARFTRIQSWYLYRYHQDCINLGASAAKIAFASRQYVAELYATTQGETPDYQQQYQSGVEILEKVLSPKQVEQPGAFEVPSHGDIPFNVRRARAINRENPEERLDKLRNKLTRIKSLVDEADEVIEDTNGQDAEKMSPRGIHDRIEEGIKNNSEKIDGNSEKIDGNSEKIDGNSEKIDGNSEKLDKNSEKLDKNSEKLDKNSEKLDKNSEKIDNSSHLSAEYIKLRGEEEEKELEKEIKLQETLSPLANLIHQKKIEPMDLNYSRLTKEDKFALEAYLAKEGMVDQCIEDFVDSFTEEHIVTIVALPAAAHISSQIYGILEAVALANNNKTARKIARLASWGNAAAQLANCIDPTTYIRARTERNRSYV